MPRKKGLTNYQKDYIKRVLPIERVLRDRTAFILERSRVIEHSLDKIKLLIARSNLQRLKDAELDRLKEILTELAVTERDRGFKTGVDYVLKILEVDPLFTDKILKP